MFQNACYPYEGVSYRAMHVDSGWTSALCDTLRMRERRENEGNEGNLKHAL